MLAAETIAESVEVYRVELVAVFNRFPSDANDFFPDRVTVRVRCPWYIHTSYTVITFPTLNFIRMEDWSMNMSTMVKNQSNPEREYIVLR